MISSEIVTQTWQRMSQVPPDQAPEMVNQMQAEQPVALSFLLHLEDFPFNRHEQELIFYIGMVVWQIMKQGEQQLYKVTRKKIRAAEELNLEILDDLASGSEGDLIGSTQQLLGTYPEPEVLRYILEAIMEEDPEEPGIRDEYKGLAFVHLKILLDAFISSRTPRPRLVA
jgi:hypothetical protein